MNEGFGTTIEQVSARLEQVLRAMKDSLSGKAAFTGEDVKKLRTVLREMEPVVLQSAELRRAQPELGPQLDRHKEQLLELQKTTEQMRITLMVQKAGLEAARTQMDATSQWCNAFQRTR